MSGAADYGTAALPSLLTLWERTRGSANEVRAVGTVSNGAMTLYTINPNVKTIADFTDKDRIAVPTVRLSFNAMMLQMAAEQQLGRSAQARSSDGRARPSRCGVGAVGRLRQGDRSPRTSPCSRSPDRGLKLPGAHVVTDSRKVFGGPLTQITLLVTKPTKDKNPELFKAVANALEQSIKVANADKRAAAALWKEVAQGARQPRRSGRPAQRSGLRVHLASRNASATSRRSSIASAP